ncbi:MAG TPA: PepSY domain-containing protein [Rhodocyclaceae bacterium]|nr:PepSY domain-containing protein [Rhodocyclaceae bacterium]
MKSLSLKLVLAATVAAASLSAIAAPKCTAEPKSKWLPEAEMKAKIAAMGYQVKEFEISGHCYEIYGHDKDGKKVEIYFNPVDASIVKEKRS